MYLIILSPNTANRIKLLSLTVFETSAAEVAAESEFPVSVPAALSAAAVSSVPSVPSSAAALVSGACVSLSALDVSVYRMERSH